LDTKEKISPKNFTRERKLPLSKLITLILSIVCNNKNKGLDTKIGEFFKNARRSGLWDNAETIHKSSFTKARKKLSWKFFENLLIKVFTIADETIDKKNNAKHLWHGMKVFGTDGSYYTLPATDEIRSKYDPNSGLGKKGKGHYPQCLVSTLYNVFSRIPVYRTVVSISEANEREEAKKLLPFVTPNSVWLFDRGYPSYDLINYLINNFLGYFVFRCPSSNSFKIIDTFVKSKKHEDIVYLEPPKNFLEKYPKKERIKLQSIKLRIIKLKSPDGKVSILLTNLNSKRRYHRKEIIDLYFKRWQIEVYYRDEKLTLEIEKFHTKTVNGILQELYSAMIMSIISRCLIIIVSESTSNGKQYFQFKNAIIVFAFDVAILSSTKYRKRVKILYEILTEISRVKYYYPKKPRPTQPRITKRAVKKWVGNNKVRRA
jgi:hypothetical protein